ncbi:metallopeptidase TldD-related protein [Haliangium ochraceum]|uniref:Zn-dependent protease n=1 Tax=Haliangium ochraceum (strain DSM 14365 / JCM 11303 / SMP-2) TaxID=502025 RepID=D0LZB0_HALO1|nr:metallopeptidase TldD-related protein [Haliangium ochraceum]ACY16372.1 Zn-dependent protease [Haliangium ochraceum DSM 14365]
MLNPDSVLDRLDQILAAHRGVDEYTVVAAGGERRVRNHRGDEQFEETLRVDAVVHRDLLGGRGSARLRVDARSARDQDALRAAVERAAQEAALGRGPEWSLPPPSAPARVSVADVRIAYEPAQALAELAAEIAVIERASGRDALWQVALERWHIALRDSHPQAGSYDSTLVTLTGVDRATGEPIAVRARALDQLDWAGAAAAAAARGRMRQRAQPLGAALSDVIFEQGALVPISELSVAPERHPPAPGAVDEQVRELAQFGWLGPLLLQAQAGWLRRGLARYQPGQSIYAGGAPAAGADGLSLSSDATSAQGLRCRPFGDWGEPARRVSLIEDGTAVRVLSDIREAALSGASPTGGPGNIAVAPGRHASEALREPGERRLVCVDSLSLLSVDPRSGDFSAEIDLAHLGDGTPTVGGGLRGNVFAVLAAARFSRELATRGWYTGPKLLRVDGVEVT